MIHLKKWESMSEEDKIDRTIKNAAIQHELQRQYDEIERKVKIFHFKYTEGWQ